MTTQGKSLEELGRRAVACKHWRWMPGMLATDPGGNRHRVVWHDAGKKYAETVLEDYDNAHVDSSVPVDGVIPFLSDPATLGCLLHLVREAWPDEWHGFMVPIFDGFSHWRVGCLQLERLPGTPQVIVPVNQETMKPLAWAYSEAEALVAALEAAP